MASEVHPTIAAAAGAVIASVRGVEHVLVSRATGLLIFRLSAEAATFPSASTEAVAATVLARTAEALDKGVMGSTRSALAMYEDYSLIQMAFPPLVLSVIAAPDANVGVLLHAALPALVRALEPLRAAAEAEEADDGSGAG